MLELLLSALLSDRLTRVEEVSDVRVRRNDDQKGNDVLEDDGQLEIRISVSCALIILMYRFLLAISSYLKLVSLFFNKILRKNSQRLFKIEQ